MTAINTGHLHGRRTDRDTTRRRAPWLGAQLIHASFEYSKHHRFPAVPPPDGAARTKESAAGVESPASGWLAAISTLEARPVL